MDLKERIAERLFELLKRNRTSEPTPSAPTMQGPVLRYTETLIEHFAAPRNVGEMSEDEADGFALVGDPGCGDQMKLWIQVREGRIKEIRFRSYGCPGAIATSSMTTELAKGLDLDAALALTDDEVVSALGGIPENKRHCSLLGIHALHQAIADCRQRRGEGRHGTTERRRR